MSLDVPTTKLPPPAMGARNLVDSEIACLCNAHVALRSVGSHNERCAREIAGQRGRVLPEHVLVGDYHLQPTLAAAVGAGSFPFRAQSRVLVDPKSPEDDRTLPRFAGRAGGERGVTDRARPVMRRRRAE